MGKVIKTGLTEKQQVTEILKNEGFYNIFEWSDSQGASYPLHTHPHYEVRWIIEGILVIEENGNKIELYPGDRFESLPNTPHRAYAPTNVTYICGSR